MTHGAEIVRIVAPSSTYGWLVRVDDIMFDLVVSGGQVLRMDRSTGFADLHTNDLKRLCSLRTDDMMKLLGVTPRCVTIERFYIDIPTDTYEKLSSDDDMLQHAGFSDLMVWVGREIAA